MPVAPEMRTKTTVERFGEITITDTPVTRDNLFRKANLDVSGTGKGSIHIRGGRIVLENVYVFADTIAEPPGSGENGDGIVLEAADT